MPILASGLGLGEGGFAAEANEALSVVEYVAERLRSRGALDEGVEVGSLVERKEIRVVLVTSSLIASPVSRASDIVILSYNHWSPFANLRDDHWNLRLLNRLPLHSYFKRLRFL